MPNGRLTRRTTPRLARGFAVLILGLIPGAGCQRFPLRYAEVTPESTSRPTTRVEPAAADTPAPEEIPVFDATPITSNSARNEKSGSHPAATIAPPSSQPAEKTGPSVATEPSSTPLIDMALNRAQMARPGTDDAPEPSPVELASLASKPADDPVELPPARDVGAGTPPVPPKSAPEPKTPDPRAEKPAAVVEAPAPEPVKVAEAPAPEPVKVAEEARPKPEPAKVAEEPKPEPEPEKVAVEPKPEPVKVAEEARPDPAGLDELPDPVPAKIAEGPKPDPARETDAPATKSDDRAASMPAPEPDSIKPNEPVEAVDDWQESLARVRRLALKRAGEPGDAAQAWAIRSRVLDWLAGEGPDATGETGRVWNSVLATLSTATGSETPDQTTLAYHLGAAVDALESYAPLQITTLSFCRKIDGFGHYDPVEAPSVRPGQPLLVYCEMVGLRYETGDDRFRSRLSSQVEVLPASGGPVVWSEALGTAEDVCRRRRRDYFVNYRIVVPARLSPGSYSLRLSQTDMVSNRSVTASVPFSVRP